MKASALNVLWANCVERLKDRVNNRSFWEALEVSHVVTLESDVLIIGLDGTNYSRSTHLQTNANAQHIASVVQEIFNRPLQVRVIEGITLADWEAAKARDARVQAMKQASYVHQVRDETQSSWDGLYEYIARMYMQTAHRALPQGKARYANEALYILVEAMDTLYPENSDDTAERSLARVLDRIASASEIPAPVLAFELERLRAWRQAESDTSAKEETEDGTAADA